MIKLMVLDLDGTLLSYYKTISLRDLDSILSAKQLGIKVCIATGRSYKSSIELAMECNADYLITSDGMCIWDINTNTKLTSKLRCFFNMVLASLPFDGLITKATGVNSLCKKINISFDDVLAIGDDFNDIELIRYAGIGATTDNAIQKIKNCANYVSPFDNNNNGVTDIIEKFCLNEFK